MFEAGEASYDPLIGAPPHRAPTAVVEAGLTDGAGYVPTYPQTLEILADPHTLATRCPGVYAIGDVAAIWLLNGTLLPKAGVFAESQARVAAQAIADDIAGRRSPARFDGQGFCYVEMGDLAAAFGSGDFYASPAPGVRLDPPSAQSRRDKLELERVLGSWLAPGAAPAGGAPPSPRPIT